jgi:hypothetical protein
MAKAKSPRTPTRTNKQVITMPEAGSLPMKKSVAPLSASPAISSGRDLETQVRQRAYELYEERGCASGFDKDDWLRAEREILGRLEARQQSA